MTETLTDEERRTCWAGCEKALRIIDAHAADRAALVAQVADLTRERDEARDQRDLLRVGLTTEGRVRAEAEAEVTRLTEALAAHESAQPFLREQLGELSTRAKAAEALVLELEERIERAVAIAKEDRLIAVLEALRG